MSSASSVAPAYAATQYGPRPLPAFLQLLRSETAASPARRDAALAGLARYQRAPRAPPPPEVPTIAQVGAARLLDYGGEGPIALFVPSLINPAAILDLVEDRSLMRWLSGRGVRPILVDWGAPDDPTLDIAGHVEHRLLPLIGALPALPTVIGYCLGGTMALAAAALTPVRAVATIAAPWRFSGYADARGAIARLWRAERPAAQAIGSVPIELLQSGFWQLDPRRTIDKYVRFAILDPDGAEARLFIALEDWANEGAPLTLAAGTELFDGLIAGDVSGRGAWRVAGRLIDPKTIAAPMFDIVSTTDRIVPAATAAGVAPTLRLSLGHVGMIVGSRARSALWQPLADWIANPHVPAHQNKLGEPAS